jgi:hypothetical protein
MLRNKGVEKHLAEARDGPRPLIAPHDQIRHVVKRIRDVFRALRVPAHPSKPDLNQTAMQNFEKSVDFRRR